MEVTDPASVEKAVQGIKEKAKTIDLLINNAGVIGSKMNVSLLEVDNNELNNVFNTNVSGVLNVTNKLIPIFNQEKKTIVINISSDISSITKIKEHSKLAYKVSKCALNMLNKVYSLEFKDKAIFVALHPGWLDTELGRNPYVFFLKFFNFFHSNLRSWRKRKQKPLFPSRRYPKGCQFGLFIER